MKTIRVKTETGQIIHIEVAPTVSVPAAHKRGGQVAGGKVKETFKQLKEVGDVIADVCKSVQQQVDIAFDKSKPDELALEFSVTLAGETGIPLVTKGTAQGTFKVNAKWKFGKEAVKGV